MYEVRLGYLFSYYVHMYASIYILSKTKEWNGVCFVSHFCIFCQKHKWLQKDHLLNCFINDFQKFVQIVMFLLTETQSQHPS